MKDDDHQKDRGRGADRPRDIPREGWGDILKRTWASIGRDHVAVVAAGVAFYGLLALFPAIVAFVAIAGYVIDEATMQEQIAQLGAALPENAAAIIEQQAMEVAGGTAAAGWGALFGFLFAMWGAARGVKALMEGMNIAYGESEDRGFVMFNAVALALTLFLILGLVIAVAAALMAPLVASVVQLPGWVATVLTYAPWPVLLVLTIFGLAVLYRYGPSREPAEWRWLTPGSVVATVIWLAGSIAFSVYVANFADYTATYGALGGVILLLTWFWLSAFVILLGAELNAEMEHQTARDTTTGEDRPMGRRGARKADRVSRRR